MYDGKNSKNVISHNEIFVKQHHQQQKKRVEKSRLYYHLLST